MIALILTGCGISPYITISFVLLNEISGFNFLNIILIRQILIIVIKNKATNLIIKKIDQD